MALSSRSQRAMSPTTTLTLSDLPRIVVTPRGRLRGAPAAQRMLAQMRLFTARQFEGAGQAGLAKVPGNEECGHGWNDAVHDRG
jgi:hypothetical protein